MVDVAWWNNFPWIINFNIRCSAFFLLSTNFISCCTETKIFANVPISISNSVHAPGILCLLQISSESFHQKEMVNYFRKWFYHSSLDMGNDLIDLRWRSLKWLPVLNWLIHMRCWWPTKSSSVRPSSVSVWLYSFCNICCRILWMVNKARWCWWWIEFVELGGLPVIPLYSRSAVSHTHHHHGSLYLQ